MLYRRFHPACALLAFSLLETSCFFKKEPRKATIIVPPSPQPPPPQPMPAPPTLPPSQGGPSLKTDGQVPNIPAPVEAPPRKKQRPAKKAQNPSTQQAPIQEAIVAPEPTATPASPVPSLQPMLGTQEAQERNRRISGYLDKARVAVYRAERSKQSQQVAELLSQVKTFLQQAEEARKTDLVRAENLAERAEVLSRRLNR